MPYTVLHIDDIEASGPGGNVRFVRRELGVQAFGINRFDLPPNSAGKEHSETATGQEEVSVVIAGSGHWTVDGEDVPAGGGPFSPSAPQSPPRPRAGRDVPSSTSSGPPPGTSDPHGPF